MSDSTNQNALTSASSWEGEALRLLQNPTSAIECPNCNAQTLSAAWYMADFNTRSATIDLKCASCGVLHSMQYSLPVGAAAFYPLDLYPAFNSALQEHLKSLSEKVQRQGKAMPVAAFTTSPLWREAKWSATTFRWHPQGERPPIMGLVFENAEAGKELFRILENAYNHTDRFEEMRISIIEGTPLGQPYGYSAHICPEPDALALHATGEDMVLDPKLAMFLGRWNRMYPIPGSRPLLPGFKEGFKKHAEFMLAPVTRREDGRNYFNTELGFIKHSIEFRELSDIGEGGIDALALVIPELVPCRH